MGLTKQLDQLDHCRVAIPYFLKKISNSLYATIAYFKDKKTQEY